MQNHGLANTFHESMSDTASERARTRIREEMDRKHLNQVDIAGLLKWSQSRISKLLSGHSDLRVDDLEAVCFAIGIQLTEAVRDHGLEFCAEMSPTELRALENLRRLDPTNQSAFLQLLDAKRRASPDRYATKPSAGQQKRKRNA